MVTPLAKRTIERVSAALQSGESPGLSEIVELIQQLSTNALNTSVQELAALIGKDLVVTAKVITAANTIGYNPTGIEVSTITQAIHVIGFNKIRQLAISLLLIENAERTLNPGEKREIAALALFSGLMAETVMAERGTLSPEHAFICASLRNYGRLLMTTFMIEEYRAARALASDGLAEDEAFNRVFGLTPLDLGRHLLTSAHLPDAILKSLRTLPSGTIRKVTENPDLELLLLADLSVRFCELALRPDVDAAEFEQQLQALSARTGRHFGMDVDAMLDTLHHAGQQLTDFAVTFGLQSLADNLEPRIKARVNREDPANVALDYQRLVLPPASTASPTPSTSSAPPAPAEGKRTPPPFAPASPVASPLAPGLSRPPTPAEITAASVAAAEAEFQSAFEQGIEELAGLLSEQPMKMHKVYDVVLKAALRGFAAREALLLVRDSAGRPFASTLGRGKLFESIRDQSLVRDTDRNVFGVCLQRLEDVFINDASDAKIVVHLPPWLKASPLASFVLLPIHDNKVPFALLLAGWSEKRTMGFTVGQIRQVRSMLKLVGTARRLSIL